MFAGRHAVERLQLFLERLQVQHALAGAAGHALQARVHRRLAAGFAARLQQRQHRPRLHPVEVLRAHVRQQRTRHREAILADHPRQRLLFGQPAIAVVVRLPRLVEVGLVDEGLHPGQGALEFGVVDALLFRRAEVDGRQQIARGLRQRRGGWRERCRGIARIGGGRRGVLSLRGHCLRDFRRQLGRRRRDDAEQHAAHARDRRWRRHDARGGRIGGCVRFLCSRGLFGRGRCDLRRRGIGRRRHRHAARPRILRLLPRRWRRRLLQRTGIRARRQQHRRQQPARAAAVCVRLDCALACCLFHRGRSFAASLRRPGAITASLASAPRATICRRSYAVGTAFSS